MKKKIIYIATIFATLFFFSACNDEWKDELYSHMISLKAPIGSEEVSDIYVRYKPNGVDPLTNTGKMNSTHT